MSEIMPTSAITTRAIVAERACGAAAEAGTVVPAQ